MNKKSYTKILILTRCNIYTGTGHLKRSLQLQLSLKKTKLDSEIWTDKSKETKKILSTINQKSKIKSFNKIPLSIQKYKQFKLVVIDIAWNDKWLEDNTQSFLKLIEKINNQNIRVVNIGKPKLDTLQFRSFIDIYPDGSKSEASGNISPRFVTLRKEFSQANIKTQKSFTGDIFLTMGGTDPLNILSKACDQLKNCTFVNHVTILIGNNSNIDTELMKKAFLKKGKKCKFLNNVGANEIIKFMQKSDIVVSAFGTTAFEAMCLGVPVIAVTHYLHQDNSAKWFSDLKSIEYLGCAEKGIKWTHLRKRLDYFYKNQRIPKNIAANANTYIDGKGNDRVTSLLKNIYEESFYNLDDLFIFAHPGTEVLATSGIIPKLVKRGKKVGIVVMGDGITSRINHTLESINISKLHIDLEESFEESCNVLGVSVKYFFRYPDNQFDKIPLLSFVKNIENILKRHKPNSIWTHQESSMNVDHNVIHKAVMVASRPIPRSKVSKVFGFKSPGAIDWSFSNTGVVEDNWFEEIDLRLESRVDSFKAYSKINYFTHDIHQINHINSQLKINGKKAGVPAAESFYVIRHVNKINEV